MKFKAFSYLLLCSIFSISQTSATTLSKILDNNWSGAYAGLRYSFSQNQYIKPSTNISVIIDNDSHEFPKQQFASINPYSLLAGLFVGYNKSINENLILGVELDASFKLNSANLHYAKYTSGGNQFSYIIPIELPLNSYLDGALRARLGLDLGKFLPYIAGGINIVYDLPNKDMIEYAQDSIKKAVDKDIQININGDDKLYLGWTLGVGVLPPFLR
ncbi:outer membrane protein [Bartonella sp. DGB1]|uniref:outer membrane protein n=1 Tax=Bartonella sp. DGB1 TaxID=3239807 RepID=UPI0035250CA2